MINADLEEGSNLSGLENEPPEIEKILLNMIEEVFKTNSDKEKAAAKNAELQQRLRSSELSLLNKHANFFETPSTKSSEGAEDEMKKGKCNMYTYICSVTNIVM